MGDKNLNNEDVQLPITAIVVGLNESFVLRNCLPSLTFCKEIHYFDLGSTDGSIVLATKLGAKVTEIEKVPFVEIVLASKVPEAETEWVLLIDPDEVLPLPLQFYLAALMERIRHDPHVGSITAPWQFYFKGKKLRGTAWGGLNSKILIAHRERVVFEPQVHIGKRLRQNFVNLQVESLQELAIEHYWMQSWRQLASKHIRYLKGEGEARFCSGQRVTLLDLLKEPFKSFHYSYIKKRGYKDGLTGLTLSVFWSWYQTSANIQLYKIIISSFRRVNRDASKIK